MKKIIVLLISLFLIFAFSSEVNALSCSPGGAACPGNQQCVNLNNDGKTYTCESMGAGLTKPGCSISFSNGNKSGNKVGDKIFVNVNTWDNGEVFIQEQPKFSGTCAQFAGFCPINANVCTKTNNAVCSNVCSTLYFMPKYPGACNISVTVSNNAGSTTCFAPPLTIEGESPKATPTIKVSPSPTPPDDDDDDPDDPGNPSDGRAFFQAVGGNVTALNDISNPNLPGGKTFVANSKQNAKDAGVVAGRSLTLPGGTKVSDANWKLVPYGSLEVVPNYQTLLTNTLRNGGFGKISDLECSPSGKRSSLNGLIRFYCYTDKTSLNNLLSEAINDRDQDANMRVLVPYEGTGGNRGGGPRELVSDFNFVNTSAPNATRPVLVFIDGQDFGGLTISKNLTTVLQNGKSAFLAVVNGDLKTANSVEKLDGVYLMTQNFNDLGGNKKIGGNGSLLGGGSGFSFNFNRTFTRNGNPAELWSFDGRYLDLFKNILARPKFFWQELSPS